jgi:hypothetical protein
VRGIECVILDFGTSQKMKLDESRHLVEMTVAREPDLLEVRFGPLYNAETIHRDEHWLISCPDEPTCPTVRAGVFPHLTFNDPRMLLY